MADISASDVKALREKTGAGIMDCKNALVETGGDFAKAEKLLKEKGLAAVEKRSGRATKEGKIFVKIKDSGAQGSTAVWSNWFPRRTLWPRTRNSLPLAAKLRI